MATAKALQSMSGATAAIAYVALVELIAAESLTTCRVSALSCLAFAAPVLTFFYIQPLPLEREPSGRKTSAIALFVIALLASIVALALLLFALHMAIGVSFLSALLLLFFAFLFL